MSGDSIAPLGCPPVTSRVDFDCIARIGREAREHLDGLSKERRAKLARDWNGA